MKKTNLLVSGLLICGICAAGMNVYARETHSFQSCYRTKVHHSEAVITYNQRRAQAKSDALTNDEVVPTSNMMQTSETTNDVQTGSTTNDNTVNENDAAVQDSYTADETYECWYGDTPHHYEDCPQYHQIHQGNADGSYGYGHHHYQNENPNCDGSGQYYHHQNNSAGYGHHHRR
ncbi:MAG: hypothetical protein HFE68_05775 [Erysipelotrichaceae bacterium]|nr:hypothetical protein [Erysipelotrichaceae bacterium]MCI9312859.1 hypothetical protein [Erysipelotrichaceae bacterium]